MKNFNPDQFKYVIDIINDFNVNTEILKNSLLRNDNKN